MGAGEIVLRPGEDLRPLVTPRVVIAAVRRRMALSENQRDQETLIVAYANVVCDLDRLMQHACLLLDASSDLRLGCRFLRARWIPFRGRRRRDNRQ
jgi:hypothetical protein